MSDARSMLERLARKLCEIAYRSPDVYWGKDSEEVAVDKDWRDYLDDAREVLQELREPTLDMEVAGTEQWMCRAAVEDRSKANWQAVIDYVLSETIS